MELIKDVYKSTALRVELLGIFFTNRKTPLKSMIQ